MRWLPLVLALAGCDLVFEIKTQGPPGEIAFVQANANQAKPGAEVATSFIVPTTSGNLLVVGLDWTGDATLSSIKTSTGDELVAIGGPADQFSLHSILYYAADIAGGPCTVTVQMSASIDDIELYIHEYAGVATTDPLDGATANIGGATAMFSGSAQLSSAGDLVFAYGVDGSVTPGEGFTARSTYNNNLTEDMISGEPGQYGATAIANSNWTFHMAAFRAVRND